MGPSRFPAMEQGSTLVSRQAAVERVYTLAASIIRAMGNPRGTHSSRLFPYCRAGLIEEVLVTFCFSN